jgi:hypothetical protein
MSKSLEKALGKFGEEIEKKYGKNWREKIIEETRRKTEEDKKKQTEVCRKFHSEQISFIRNYENKNFEISKSFFDASMIELKRSFQNGEERGMILVFRETDGKVLGDEFYDNSWIERNKFGYTTPFRMWIIDEKTGKEFPHPLGSFGFHYDALYEMMKSKDSLIVPFHTHCYKAEPSEIDLEIKPYCGGIIGFEKVSEELKKLTHDTFGVKEKPYKIRKAKPEDFVKPEEISEEDWNEVLKELVGKDVGERIPFKISEDIYKSILEECKPSIRIFYTDNEKLAKIPLYLGNKKLN